MAVISNDMIMNIRRKLYTALSAIPIVEPVRVQHLNKLLFFLANNLAGCVGAERSAVNDGLSGGQSLLKKRTDHSIFGEPSKMYPRNWTL